MAKSYLYGLADRFENKLKKLAAMPDKASVHNAIANIFSSNSSNSVLKGCTGVAPEVSLSGGGFGDPMLVYFQVMCDPRAYEQIIQGPRKQQITDLLKPIVEQQLAALFHQYEFKVTVGVVPNK